MSGNGKELVEKRMSDVKLPTSKVSSSVNDISWFVNKVFQGDSRDFLKRIPSSTVDMVITSPPYNFQKEYSGNESNDDLSLNEYFNDLLLPVWKECHRVLKTGGRMAINIQPIYSKFVPSHHVITDQMASVGFNWRTELIWVKNNFSCPTAWGSFKSPSNPFVRFKHEYIEVFDKDSRRKDGEPANIDIKKEEFVKWTMGNWHVAPERSMQRFNHPAMFPIEIPLRLMKLYTYTKDIILDPFMGAGSTAIACLKSSRHFIGIDISEDYCETARKRIKSELSQRKLEWYII